MALPRRRVLLPAWIWAENTTSRKSIEPQCKMGWRPKVWANMELVVIAQGMWGVLEGSLGTYLGAEGFEGKSR